MTSMWGTRHSTLGSLWSAETLKVILVKQGGEKINLSTMTTLYLNSVPQK